MANWITFALGTWVFVAVLLSPRLLGFEEIGRSSLNAGITGLGIAMISAAAVRGRYPWVAWGNVLLGAWLFVSPWVLDYVPVETAARYAWIVGAVVVVMAAIAASTASPVDQRPPTRLGRS